MLINNHSEEILELAAEIIAGRQQTIEQIIIDSLCKSIESCTLDEIFSFLRANRETYSYFIER